MKELEAPFNYALATSKKAFRFPLLLIAAYAFLVGCTTTDYFGKTYPPTQRVAVFFSAQDVSRPFEVMGVIHAQADELVSFQAMQRQLMTDAMQKGADAILIENVGKIETGITTVESRIKEKNARHSSTTFSSAQIETDRVVKAQLLKYR
jgi:hypothetical protein